MTVDESRAGQIAAALSRLGTVWSCAALVDRTTVRFSTRLTQSVARADVARSVVTLSASLLSDSKVLDEVLCHEVAHLVAHARVGRAEPPHGPTWQELVRQGGHVPALRISLLARTSESQSQAPASRRFVHRCLVCSFIRVSRRRMPHWRCRDCVDAGLDGTLAIQEARDST